MKQAQIIRDLPCQMTEQERVLKSVQLAARIDEIVRLDNEKKAFNAGWKEKKEDCDVACRELAKEVRTGLETRPIVCEEERSFTRNMVDLIRTDTNEVVHSRPMHPDERQAALNFENRPTTEPEAH